LPLSILNDSVREATEKNFARFDAENVLNRVRAIANKGDLDARRAALAAITPEQTASELLIRIGMEIDAEGHVTKNSYGVLDLPWQAQEHPEWPQLVADEVQQIRDRIQAAHGVKLRFIIWAGMGGSMEDKTAYTTMGLLKGGPLFYSLDSTDPEKLKSIIDDMQKRSGEPIARLLPATLVVGMAMGMTSYEPVVNLEKLAGLYDKFKIDSTPNFIYLTMPGSVLDQFAGPRGYHRVPLQLDEDNTTAGRHSAPLTRGTLYPLALAARNTEQAARDLKEWIDGSFLTGADISEAFKLASFLHAQGEAGRDKVTLLMPRSWAPAGLWTKQDIEESLGKSPHLGIKIVIGEKFNGKNYRKASDPKQDRLFLVIQRRGEPHPDGDGITSLRAAKYPMAVVTFPSKGVLSRYMQSIHYVVFALGYLRKMNFVTQPSVELYKAITSEIFTEAKNDGGIIQTKAWKTLGQSAAKRWHGVVSLETPESLANAIRYSADSNKISYGELTFFGDMRYSEEGKLMRKAIENAAQRIFRVKLKMVADVYEGPAMNHSYHEMIIGHGQCFSIILLSEQQTRFSTANYDPDYHMAQFLATKLALERKGRVVRAILVKDLAPESIKVLEEFFSEAAALLELQASRLN
jgi:glucose-6-phosphate isomerase